jgi:Tfp pilus assembly protein FimT
MVRRKRTFNLLEIPKLVRIWDKRRKFQRGFTLVELILIVLFLGIFAVITVPRLQFATLYGKQADTVAKKIVTDLRRTRTLAISNAANNTYGFALNMTGTGYYTGYEIVNLKPPSATVDSHTIDSDISCAGGATFQFGPLGNLLAGSNTQLTVAAGGKTFTITIVSATGAVKCQEEN